MLMRRLCDCAKREAGSCRRSGAWNSTRNGREGRLGGCKACGPGVGKLFFGTPHHLPSSPSSFLCSRHSVPHRPSHMPGSVLPQSLCSRELLSVQRSQGSFLSLCLLPTDISPAHFI